MICRATLPNKNPRVSNDNNAQVNEHYCYWYTDIKRLYKRKSLWRENENTVMLFRAKTSLTPWWRNEWAANDISVLRFSIIARKIHIEHAIPCYHVTLPTINVLYSFNRLPHGNNIKQIPYLPHNRLWKRMSRANSAQQRCLEHKHDRGSQRLLALQ